ncbi:MAG: hypothetical protein JNL38_33720 [Myxococcales bacterium]|nr:hypothetical protein [Myxococcales bacterium]
MNADAAADRFVRAVRSLSDANVRLAYVLTHVRDLAPERLAPILEVVCSRAEQADPAAREVLVSLLDAAREPAVTEAVQRLREQAVGEAFVALERALRNPMLGRSSALPEDPDEDRVPDYGRGRPLTLGERKALARRPDRAMMERLVRDPHPAVIERLLVNPKLTEDDVLTMVVKRPARPDVLSQIARSTRWIHRPRIRRALVLNPDCPPEIAGPITGLLLRQELRLVIESTHVPPSIRALCMEHLERRPPSEGDDEDAPLQ